MEKKKEDHNRSQEEDKKFAFALVCFIWWAISSRKQSKYRIQRNVLEFQNRESTVWCNLC